MKSFYNKYKKGVTGFVAKKIDDPMLVEELTHDILLAAWKAYPSFDGRCKEFSWICSIANHKIIDYYRKKKLKTVLFSVSPVFEEIADKSLSPERDVLKNELKNEIAATFDEISKGYKKILRLKYVDGLKIKQIAKKMGITIKAVEGRLSRARTSFKVAWQYDKKNQKNN